MFSEVEGKQNSLPLFCYTSQLKNCEQIVCLTPAGSLICHGFNLITCKSSESSVGVSPLVSVFGKVIKHGLSCLIYYTYFIFTIYILYYYKLYLRIMKLKVNSLVLHCASLHPRYFILFYFSFLYFGGVFNKTIIPIALVGNQGPSGYQPRC